MQAGFFRWEKSAPSVRRLNAISCRNFGIELIFFGPEDVDMEKGNIHGESFINNKWIKKTVPIPKIINNTPFKKQNIEIHDYLSSNSHFMFKSFGGKRKEYNLFKNEPSLKHLLIPSERIKNIEHVREFVSTHKKAVFKPLRKANKQNMFSLEANDDTFILDDGKNRRKISEDEFQIVYNELIKGQGLLMSKYIHSKTKMGHPFDIRLDLEKNEQGKWVRAQNYVSIGINDTLTSNIEKGGGVIKTNSFLRSEFDQDESTRITEEIKDVSRKLPKAVEKMVDFEINSIGLDLGIDRDGKLYMFEISTYPDSTFAVGQIAYLRAGYMYYYLQNLVDETEQ